MKKTITKPDGTIETIEGEPEEIRRYEDKAPAVAPQRFEQPYEPVWPTVIHSPNCQLILAMRGWWSVVPPACTCGAEDVQVLPRTTTSDTITYRS